MTAPAPGPGGRSTTVAALAGVVALLAVANVARSTVVPSGAHLAFNLGLAAAVAAVGVAVAALAPAEVGLGPDRVGPGVRWGLAALGAVVVATAVAAAVPAARGFFAVDDADVDGAGLVRRVALVIPLGTVVVEELAFRGVLHGLLARLFPVGRAVVVGAVLFGLWHVVPAWRSTEGDPSPSRLGLVAGTMAATTGAGWVFGWLRVRSGSLLAPWLAHLATNTVPLTAAWVLARPG